MIKYLIFILFTTAFAWADDESVYAELARLRQYPSGADESDLKVQPVLSQFQDKKKTQINPEPIEGF